ncbi:MAG: excinuclease ABC subunit UvrC [Candidatus Peregrinibacteria bacterium]
MPISPLITDKLLSLPVSPGVYEMRNEDDQTLYVGKAKNLKNRVKSYFLPSAKHSPRIQKLIEKATDLFWTETSSEIEALVLESNLIKEKNPKFNILLRDDKNFVYIKVTVNEDFPRIFTTRRIVKDGAKYFGPKTSSSSVHQTIDLLQDILKFRSTPLEITENTPGSVTVKSAGNLKYPCLNYHLKKCDAPCIGNMTKADYRKKIDEALRFLKGDYHDILKYLQERMQKLAKEGKFEIAAKVRDQYFSVQKISETQLASAPDELSADIIGMTELFGRAFFHVFSVRDGKMVNSETFSVDLKEGISSDGNHEQDGSEALKAFLRDHPGRVDDAPKVIVVDSQYFLEEEKDLWEEYFRISFGKSVEITLPRQGKRKKLLELAQQNAVAFAKRNSASFLKRDEDSDEVLKILQEKLGLEKIPKRMECYDISHFSGTETGASMVVFENGEPKPADYRHFSIKTLARGDIDDFASLQEVLTRRLARLPKKFPEDWKWKKLTTKKDFAGFMSESTVWARLIAPLQSRISFSPDGKLEKQKMVQFWVVETVNEVETVHAPSLQNAMAIEDDNETARVLWWSGRDAKSCVSPENACEGAINPAPPEQNDLDRFALTSFLSGLRGKKTAEIILSPEDDRIALLEEYGFETCRNALQCVSTKSLSKNKKESFQQIPDLIVIDGGKGQLSSVVEILEKTEYASIPLCSLAKREEEVFVPHKKDPIAILKDSPEGYLLQRLRDEAHRFAITKNRTDREKSAQKSVLDTIPGIGGKTKKLLKEKFGSIAKIKNASDTELLEIVSGKVLKNLRENL